VNVYSGFVRALEAEYEARVLEGRAVGLNHDDAHQQALSVVRELGEQALLDLRRRGVLDDEAA